MPYKDPDKAAKAKHESYLRNKEKIAKREKARKEQKRNLARSLMTPCVECGDFDVAFMDWHHIDPAEKENSVSELIRHGTEWALLKEIERCINLCANCHRKLHFYH